MKVKYPHYRDELVKILEQDQEEVREYSRAYKENPEATELKQLRKLLTERNLQRVQRVLGILDDIGVPTLESIGEEGLEAMSVIALHSKYSIMKRVLTTFERAYQQNPASIKAEYIPSMTDRVLMLEGKKQHFGTQWMVGTNGRPFLYPVENFAKMNELRAQYGLGKARHPRDLTYGIPKGPLPPYAKENDQRQPTKEEYDYHVSELQD